MIFGISTWFYQELSIVEALNHIAASGFRAAEIWMHHLWKTKESAHTVLRCAKELGLALSLHAATYDVNPTSINPGIRDESLRQIKHSIQTAPELGAELVVVHPGRLSASRGNVDKCWNFIIEALSKIDRWADKAGVKVGIEAMENASRQVFVKPTDMMRLFKTGWKNIGLTLDIAHAYTCMDPIRYIGQVDISCLVHVHLSDSSKDSTHAPLGKGDIDIDRVLKALGSTYKGLVIVEGYVPGKSFETVRSNAEYLKKLGWL